MANKKRIGDTHPAARITGAARAGLKNYRGPDWFGKVLGHKVVSVNRKTNEAVLSLKVRRRHLSPPRRIHGGVIAACFDVVLGIAVFSTMDPWDVTSTVELKVNYLKPIHLGDELVFKSSVDFRGKRLCVVHAYVYKKGERSPAGMSSGTYYVVPRIKTELPESPTSKGRRRAS